MSLFCHNSINIKLENNEVFVMLCSVNLARTQGKLVWRDIAKYAPHPQMNMIRVNKTPTLQSQTVCSVDNAHFLYFSKNNRLKNVRWNLSTNFLLNCRVCVVSSRNLVQEIRYICSMALK